MSHGKLISSNSNFAVFFGKGKDIRKWAAEKKKKKKKKKNINMLFLIMESN